jgi:hypothetical protein
LKRLFVLIVLAASCRFAPGRTPPSPPSTPSLPPTPRPIIPRHGEVDIAAWAEPRSVPAGGGQVQIIVRVKRVGDGPYAGVQVTTQSDYGTLLSAGKPLVTDRDGMARDRLTTKSHTLVIVQVGDMRYRFKVPVRAAS